MSGQESEINNPDVGIVILNWNGYEDTIDCLESLSDIDYPSHSVVVVDNGSKDRSGVRIDDEFPDVQVIFTGENLGFAGGCNVGIDALLEDGADHVLLLNNDTLVEHDFLVPLVQTAQRHEKVAAVGSVVRRMDKDEVWSAGGSFSPIFTRLNVNKSVRGPTEYETEFISGAALFLPRNAIEELGALDESYFYGFEDQEYAYRAREHGWSLYINPDSVVRHKVGSSSGQGNEFRFYQATRNRLTFSSMHHSNPERVMFYLFFLWTRLIRGIQWGVINREYSGRARGLFLGMWDHLCGREIRRPEQFGLGPGSAE